MTEKEIVRLAKEAELWLHSDRKYEAVKKFAELVAAAEREACAKVCDDMSGPIEIYNPAYVHYIGCAKTIRARGQHGN
jgi:hypothetical protein